MLDRKVINQMDIDELRNYTYLKCRELEVQRDLTSSYRRYIDYYTDAYNERELGYQIASSLHEAKSKSDSFEYDMDMKYIPAPQSSCPNCNAEVTNDSAI